MQNKYSFSILKLIQWVTGGRTSKKDSYNFMQIYKIQIDIAGYSWEQTNRVGEIQNDYIEGIMLLVNRITYRVCPHIIVKHLINTNDNYHLLLNYVPNILICYLQSSHILQGRIISLIRIWKLVFRERDRKDYLPY